MAEYYFNLPPFDRLTITQQAALVPVEPIALSGGPGTGKSVVSLYRHIARNAQGKNCQLLTYTTTLGLYLKRCCATQNVSAAEKVGTTFRWCLNPQRRDEIIIDEAQDVNVERYNNLKLFTKGLSYGADEAQSLFPEQGSSIAELRSLFPENKPFLLTKNFRNTKSILRFARNAFPNANISQQDIDTCQSDGNKPVLFISNGNKYEQSNKIQDDAILNIIDRFASTDAHNIAILCPWGRNVQYFYDLVKEKHPSCTFFYREDTGIKEISNIHVTTFKSAKGLEFDTVIIPNFHKVYEDTPPEFHLDWKDFYVGVTRSKINLFLISYENVRHLNNYVELDYL